MTPNDLPVCWGNVMCVGRGQKSNKKVIKTASLKKFSMKLQQITAEAYTLFC